MILKYEKKKNRQIFALRWKNFEAENDRDRVKEKRTKMNRIFSVDLPFYFNAEHDFGTNIVKLQAKYVYNVEIHMKFSCVQLKLL